MRKPGLQNPPRSPFTKGEGDMFVYDMVPCEAPSREGEWGGVCCFVSDSKHLGSHEHG